jgi:hypothetical protein
MPTETVILVTHEEEIALCPQSHSFARRTHWKRYNQIIFFQNPAIMLQSF